MASKHKRKRQNSYQSPENDDNDPFRCSSNQIVHKTVIFALAQPTIMKVLLKYIDLFCVLNCRSVCHDWKNIFDMYLSYWTSIVLSGSCGWAQRRFPIKIDEFLQHFPSLRALRLNRIEFSPQQYLVTKLHVKRLEIIGCDFNSLSLDDIKRFIMCFPSLESLFCSSYCLKSCNFSKNNFGYLNDFCGRCRSFWIFRFLNSCKNLKEIEVNCDFVIKMIPTPVKERITSLRLFKDIFVKPPLTGLSLQSFKNLRKIYLDGFSYPRNFQLLFDCPSLEEITFKLSSHRHHETMARTLASIPERIVLKFVDYDFYPPVYTGRDSRIFDSVIPLMGRKIKHLIMMGSASRYDSWTIVVENCRNLHSLECDSPLYPDHPMWDHLKYMKSLKMLLLHRMRYDLVPYLLISIRNMANLKKILFVRTKSTLDQLDLDALNCQFRHDLFMFS